MTMISRVAVIIPYYQWRVGLLADALTSVFAQTAPNVVSVIVIDDGSPHPASAELAELSAAERSRIMLIEQQNGGVSAARNRGINSLSPDIDLVAFLDPDDRWSTDHVANALAAFEQGALFYFSDFRRDNSQQTRFERIGFCPDPKTRLRAGKNLYRYEGDIIFDMTRSPMSGTSTVIMKRSLIGKHRFREDISAFEDLLFWLTCLSKSEKSVIFSTNCEALYCSTDGLITSAVWGSRRSLEVISDQVRVLYALTAFANGKPEFQDWISAERRRLGREFFITAGYRAFHLKPIHPRILVNFLRVWLSPIAVT